MKQNELLRARVVEDKEHTVICPDNLRRRQSSAILSEIEAIINTYSDRDVDGGNRDSHKVPRNWRKAGQALSAGTQGGLGELLTFSQEGKNDKRAETA